MGFTRYTTSTLRSTAMLGPSHPVTKVRCSVGSSDPVAITLPSAATTSRRARLSHQAVLKRTTSRSDSLSDHGREHGNEYVQTT